MWLKFLANKHSHFGFRVQGLGLATADSVAEGKTECHVVSLELMKPYRVHSGQVPAC